MNAHWHARFFGYVVQHPFAWLGQLVRKAYALVNDWEQYNNKTFAFHQARSPWLRWNPLSWGIIFVLGVAGAVRLASTAPRTAWSLAWITGACAASVLLFYVSARFRLPLAALATVLAGGGLAAPDFWKTWPSPRRLGLGVLVLGAAAITFSSFDRVRSRATFVQDHVLLARAAATVGDDALAWDEASAALMLQPSHPDALRIAVASYFNQLLAGTARPDDEGHWEDASVALLLDSHTDAPDLRAAATIAIWRVPQHDMALGLWRLLGATPSALAARILAHDPTASRAAFAALPPAAWSQPLVRLAGIQLDLAPPAGVMLDSPGQAAAQVQRIFSARALP